MSRTITKYLDIRALYIYIYIHILLRFTCYMRKKWNTTLTIFSWFLPRCVSTRCCFHVFPTQSLSKIGSSNSSHKFFCTIISQISYVHSVFSIIISQVSYVSNKNHMIAQVSYISIKIYMAISQVSYVSKNKTGFPQKIYIVRNLYGLQKQKPSIIEASGWNNL